MMAWERLLFLDYIIHECFFDEGDGIRDGLDNDLRKILRFPKGMEENFCEVLEFIQLFATSSLDEIEFDDKTNVARQFIMITKRQDGLVNNNIPCLIISQVDHQIIWIPNEQELD